jgi:uncharacterized membrane protein
MKRIRVILLLGVIFACQNDKNTPSPFKPGETPGSTTPEIPGPTASTCDTASITFEKSIWPIVQNNCMACHNATAPSGNVDLSTYDKIIPYVKNGKLYASMTHLPGYSPMPSSTSSLTSCELNMVKKWIIGSYPSGTILVDLKPINPVNPIVTTPTTPPPTTNVICNPDTVYFKQKILPLIVSNCAMSGCHDAISKKEGVVLTDYTNIIKEVNTKNPTSSKLYTSLLETGEDRMPPPPMAGFSKENIAMVLTWIKQGAKNNSCEASGTACITTNISYAKDLVPILQASCTGCHSGTKPQGAIDLTTYANVYKYALNGKLYGSVAHIAGYIAMPSASVRISSCEISKIKSWIDSGSKNN